MACTNARKLILLLWEEYFSEKEAKNIDIKNFVEGIKEIHKPTNHCFHKGYGIVLQRVNSLIAEYVLEFFAENHELYLCVHDSFIVRESKSDYPQKAMDIAHDYALNNIMS
ncbi:hypothetical protein [Microbulbifer sp. THAF38]|uniref:hypothetical protein n=1 Tax=Microbulbifer sp. THAF38 TaxID=2587856 RepID=UPI0012692355|nr:hypothetical protein [Microbulbifer sp. THAF38]